MKEVCLFFVLLHIHNHHANIFNMFQRDKILF